MAYASWFTTPIEPEGVPSPGNGPEVEAEVADQVEVMEEDGFRRVVPLLFESWGSGRGRTFDPQQIAALAQGLLEMSQTIDMQIGLIGDLQLQVEEMEKKKRIWTPNK